MGDEMGDLEFEEIKKVRTLIVITTTREDYKLNYSIRSRIGLLIARILCIVSINFIDNK